MAKGKFTGCLPPDNTGKLGYNDGIKNYRMFPEEAESEGYIKGFIKLSEEKQKEKRNKQIITNTNLYGDPNYNNREKAKQTNKANHGGEYFVNFEKRKLTIIGSSGSWETYVEYVNDLRNDTWINRYGSLENLQKQKTEKMLSTTRAKYGCVGGTHKYLYDNQFFDSSWELAFYIYLTDRGEIVNRLPTIFEYYIGDTKHRYYPDFEYNGDIIEIKADSSINKEGILVDIRDHNKELVEKTQCIIQNNVKILFRKDILFMLKYCEEKYNNKKWYKEYIYSKAI